MRNMKIKQICKPLLFLCTAMMVACNQENVMPRSKKACLELDLSADASFSTTKAINQSQYNDIRNYEVTLYKIDKTNNEQRIHSAKYADWDLAYEVESGVNYLIRASYGREEAASYDHLLCQGEQTFSVQSGTTKRLSFQCKPKAAKISLSFSPDFFQDSYGLGDCDVEIKTKHMATPWILNKSTQDKDLYIKAEKDEAVELKFKIKDKEGHLVEEKITTRSVRVNPQTWLKIKLEPQVQTVQGGKFSLQVRINDALTEETIDILLPNTIF